MVGAVEVGIGTDMRIVREDSQQECCSISKVYPYLVRVLHSGFYHFNGLNEEVPTLGDHFRPTELYITSSRYLGHISVGRNLVPLPGITLSPVLYSS